MRSLSSYKDEEALDVLADLLEPVMEIMSDKEVADSIRSKNKAKGIKLAIKNHKASTMEVMAILEGVPVEEYHCNLLTLPLMLLKVLNDPELVSFFSSQAEIVSEMSSGSAMGNTEDEGDIS